jgi:hypothetical protein
MDVLCRCSAVLVINNSHQGFTKTFLRAKVESLASLRVEAELPTLGWIVAHTSIIGCITVPHHSGLIAVLVGSFTGMTKGKVVAKFMNLSRWIPAPIVVVYREP